MKLSSKQVEVLRRMAQMPERPVEVGYFYNRNTMRVLRREGLIRLVNGTIYSQWRPDNPMNSVEYRIQPRGVTLAVLTPDGIWRAREAA